MSNLNTAIVNLDLPALGTAKTRGFRAPFTGRILSVGYASYVAADDTNVLQAEIDEVDVTGGVLTLTAALTVAGKCLVARPTALNSFREGQYISIDTDGGGTVGDGVVTFVLEKD